MQPLSSNTVEMVTTPTTTRDIRYEYDRLRGHALQTIIKKAVKFCDGANNDGQTIELIFRVCLLTPWILKRIL